MTNLASPAPAAPALRIYVILAALMAYASISTDLYLPAMPAMATSLHADAGQVELTVSGYLIGFSLGQLLWGPIGDRHGRRWPIALGLLLFIAGSAGCALSTQMPMLIGWRVVQALGACASVVLARAIVRDLYAGDHAARVMSTLLTVMAVAPLVGPSVGAFILQWASWRAIFWVLVVVGLATLAAVCTLPETLPVAQRNPEPLWRALRRYADLLRHRQLLGYASSIGLLYGGIFAYVAGTPFAYIGYHHVSPQTYGVLFGLNVAGIMVANQVNARLLARYGADRLMRAGTVAAALAGAVLAICAASGAGGLLGLVLPIFVFVSASGFIVANAMAGALSLYPKTAGSASAFIGATQYGGGMLGAGLVGLMADGTPRPMGLVIALGGVGCMACALWLVRPAARRAAS